MRDDIDVMEALAEIKCWCQVTTATGRKNYIENQNIMLALGGEPICEVCNNGVDFTAHGVFYRPEHANGKMHHCTTCHIDTPFLHHKCSAPDAVATGRCPTCLELINIPRYAHETRFDHTCLHTPDCGDQP